ncbi:MAG: nucleotidyltransferase domain-containing protein [archaeon]
MVSKKSVRKTGLKSEKLDKIMELIYENPQKDFTVREIEKQTKLPRATISEYLKEMKKLKLLDKYSLLFKIKKSNYFIEEVVGSGLIEFIIEELNPSCIILFGSIRKGESDKESDIDLFVETVIKKELDFTKYEKIIKHPVQIFTEIKISNLPENLFNNVINGIKLYGSFRVK